MSPRLARILRVYRHVLRFRRKAEAWSKLFEGKDPTHSVNVSAEVRDFQWRMAWIRGRR